MATEVTATTAEKSGLDGDGATATGPAATTAEKSGGKTLTNDDVNRIVAKRIAEEKRKLEEAKDKEIEELSARRLAEWREEQGLDDETLAKVKKPDESAKVKRELAEERKRAAKVEADLASWQQRHSRALKFLRETRGKDAVYKIASPLSDDLESIWLHLQNRVRLDEEGDEYRIDVVDEKGEISAATIEDLVRDLLTRKPHLAKPTIPRGAGAPSVKGTTSGGNGMPDLTTEAGRKEAIRLAARKSGLVSS